MTTDEAELPREIEDFLRRQVASHDQLKLLLLMSDEPTRWWTLEQLGRVVGGRMSDVVETMDPLIGAGLLVCRATRLEALYRFAPARAADALLVARLRELDAQRSPVLLRAVSAHAIERIRAEARKTFGDH
jgi:hypothetical protein